MSDSLREPFDYEDDLGGCGSPYCMQGGRRKRATIYQLKQSLKMYKKMSGRCPKITGLKRAELEAIIKKYRIKILDVVHPTKPLKQRAKKVARKKAPKRRAPRKKAQAKRRSIVSRRALKSRADDLMRVGKRKKAPKSRAQHKKGPQRLPFQKGDELMMMHSKGELVDYLKKGMRPSKKAPPQRLPFQKGDELMMLHSQGRLADVLKGRKPIKVPKKLERRLVNKLDPLELRETVEEVVREVIDEMKENPQKDLPLLEGPAIPVMGQGGRRMCNTLKGFLETMTQDLSDSYEANPQILGEDDEIRGFYRRYFIARMRDPELCHYIRQKPNRRVYASLIILCHPDRNKDNELGTLLNAWFPVLDKIYGREMCKEQIFRKRGKGLQRRKPKPPNMKSYRYPGSRPIEEYYPPYFMTAPYIDPPHQRTMLGAPFEYQQTIATHGI